jgi:Alginate export
MKLRLFRICTLILLALTPNLAAQQASTGNANQMFSDELNQTLPKWLRFSGEYRARVEGFIDGGFKPNNEDAYLLSRLRLNMIIQPQSWLKFGFQAQDARVFGKNQNPPAPPYQDTMDLRLGYVQIGDVEKKTIGFRAGRQELAFGDERLVGNVNWVNTARSFDALRGTYRHNGYRVDLFAASVVNPKDGQFDKSANGNYFYGIYGGMAKLIPRATVEPYFFWRRSSGLTTETGGPGILNFGTVGVRMVGKLASNWDYGLEMDRQAGSLGTDSIGAWAGHWVVGRTFATAHLHPRVALEYNYASGDRNPNDGHRGTFDQLYPTGHDKYGMADQVGWKNIRDARASLETKPGKKWLVVGRYDAWWLADPRDALYSAASGVVARVASGTAGRFVGQELDGAMAYNLSRQFQFGGGYGHIFPGTFLNHATPGKSYSYPYAMTTFVF